MATNSASAKVRGSLLDRMLLSPTAQRRMTWLSALVLLAGIVAAVFVFVFPSRSTPASSPGTKSGQTTPSNSVHVKPSANAFGVAREFLQTAVLRKRLHYAYTLVGPSLKAGLTRKQWESGTNPVQPYPVKNAATTRFIPLSSTKDQLFVKMQLVPEKGSGQRAYLFYMVLIKPHGKWLVDNFYVANQVPLPYSGGEGGF